MCLLEKMKKINLILLTRIIFLKEMPSKCIFDGCNNHPSFGTTKKIHCSKHKGVEEVDLVHPRCIFIGCPREAHFGTDKRLTCGIHKRENEVYFGKSVCKFAGC